MTTASAGHIQATTIAKTTTYSILFAISTVHLLNDSMQAVVVALFPILEQALRLSYTQIGWLAFALNMTSSVMQPFVGLISDKRPMPRLVPFGMGITLCGLIGLALAPRFSLLIVPVIAIGLGSAIFHPEGSRIVYYAAGNRRSLAQSIYQVGGNAGNSLAPLMTMFIFAPLGQRGALWATGIAVTAIAILLFVIPWYQGRLATDRRPSQMKQQVKARPVTPVWRRPTIVRALIILVLISIARAWYTAGIGTFFQFFGMEHYNLSIRSAQVPVFIFMAAGVAGTLFGGILADRIGTRNMMLLSICGSAPLALLLPHVPFMWIYPLIGLTGFLLQSGFSVSVVYAQQLLPDHVGMASGLIVGLAFGMGALGAVALGKAADVWGLAAVMTAISYILLLGFLGFGLPKPQQKATT